MIEEEQQCGEKWAEVSHQIAALMQAKATERSTEAGSCLCTYFFFPLMGGLDSCLCRALESPVQ